MRADELLALQRELFAALRAPLTGPSRQRAGLAAPRGGGAHALPERFIAAAERHLAPSSALSAPDRLEVYHRQYWLRLLESLADDFPGLRLLLGPRSFTALAEAYLLAAPPGTGNLRHLGAGLAAFLSSGVVEVSQPVWAEELARLESAWIAAFDAGAAPAPSGAELAQRALALQPHVTLLALRSGADRLWRRAQDGQGRGRVRPAADAPVRFVAVVRPELARQLEVLHPAAYSLLESLRVQGSLEVALEAAAPRLPQRRQGELIERWFRQWTAERWLALRDEAAREEAPRDDAAREEAPREET